MEIKQLATPEEPKQLTARHTPQNLYEHFMAFMNANNQNGFMDDSGGISDYTKFAKRLDNEEFSIDTIQAIGKDTVVGLMVMVATQDTVNYREVLRFGYEIKEVSGRKIRLNKAQIIVARLLGYYNHDALYKELRTKYQINEIPKERRHEYLVDNRRDRSMLYMKFLEELSQ